VVVNNGLYKSVADRQKHWYGGYYATELSNPSYEKVAKAFGCDGYTTSNAGELRAAVKSALAARRPAVIEVKVAYDNMLDTMPPDVKKFVDRIFPERRTGWPMPKPGPLKR
jgi:thiamine pyrophosphate-dependent acetolactate synthase large subunit-like protein